VERQAPGLSIIIPTYNERECIGTIVPAVFDACRDLNPEVVIVDDNSPDGTGAMADELATRHRVTVVHRAGKLGLGAAVVEGIRAATSDVVAVMDADFSHPPAHLPLLSAAFARTQADLLVASRYVPGGGTRNWPWQRQLYSRLACWLARPLTPVRDPVSGFFLIRRDLAAQTDVKARGFKICLELLVRAEPARVVEAPFLFNDREGGKSKMSVIEAARFLTQFRDLYLFQFRRPGRDAPTYHRLSTADLMAGIRPSSDISGHR
jgi:dolichol-phosphate mannosyltransferase